MANETPTRCPFCGSRDITTDVVEWQAQSLDPTDRTNNAVLDEHQCRGCSRSFWS